MIGIVAWLLIGASVSAIFARSNRYAFPAGRASCVIGGLAGGFLGGGTAAVATEAGAISVSVSSSAAAASGAAIIVVAVGWAGRGVSS